MPERRKPRPLWQLHIVLGCAIVTPLLLFGAYAGISIAALQARPVLGDLMSGAHTLSAEVGREIVGEIERLQVLAASSSPRVGDFAGFRRQAEASLTVPRRQHRAHRSQYAPARPNVGPVRHPAGEGGRF
jgi:hypothetical protein